MQEIIPVLIRLLLIAIVGVFLFWATDRAGVPAPFNWIVKGIILIVILIASLPLLGVAI